RGAGPRAAPLLSHLRERGPEGRDGRLPREAPARLQGPIGWPAQTARPARLGASRSARRLESSFSQPAETIWSRSYGCSASASPWRPRCLLKPLGTVGGGSSAPPTR